MITEQHINSIVHSTAVASDGAKLGKVGEIYLDDQTGRPEWATVNTGLFGTKETFVPLAQAEFTGEELRFPYTKATVKDAPRVTDENGHLSEEEEAELYRYYGLSSPGTAADSGVDGHRAADHAGEPGVVGHDTSGPTTDRAMTRSEERLKVGTQQVETGRARLRKHVVIENVTQLVPVSHEQVRVEREPITEANIGNALDGPAISEEEHEVTLHAERPVVQKDAVPVERIRLDKHTVTEQQQVNEQVRKEQIELDGDAVQSRR
jgi:uncharacterized protein (TIGR02271 family)